MRPDRWPLTAFVLGLLVGLVVGILIAPPDSHGAPVAFTHNSQLTTGD